MTYAKKDYIRMLNHRPYLAVNDMDFGYAILTPMLLIAPDIAIHSPASGAISESNKDYPQTAISVSDFDELITNEDETFDKPLIIPTAFSSFREREYRDAMHPTFSLLSPFDEKFVDESSNIYDKIQIIPDNRLLVAKRRIEFAKNLKGTTTRELLNKLKFSGEYDKIVQVLANYQISGNIPEQTQLFLEEPIDIRVLAFSFYNYDLNNVASETGGSSIDAISEEHRVVAESSTGIDYINEDFQDTNPAVEGEVIRGILEEITEFRAKPISMEMIRNFRVNDRDLLVDTLAEIFVEIQAYEDSTDKVLVAKRMTSDSLESVSIPEYLIGGLSRLISVCSLGIVHHEDLAKVFLRIADSLHINRTLRYTLMKDPPKINISDDEKEDMKSSGEACADVQL